MQFVLAFVFLLSGVQYPLIDATPEATMVCSGSGSVFIEDKTIYYCPNIPNILMFQCDVHDSNILEWKVSQSNHTIAFGAFSAVMELKTGGYMSAFLKVVQKNSDVSKNNFTSIMHLDTEDLVGPITTVTCETSDPERFDKHYLISLDGGDLPTFKNFSVSLKRLSRSVIVHLEWDYPGNRSQILGYETVIQDETAEVVHNRTLGPDINDTICELSSLNTYKASIKALSRCTEHHSVMEKRYSPLGDMDHSEEGDMDHSEEDVAKCSTQESREDSSEEIRQYSNGSEGASTPLTVGLTVGLAAVLVLCFLTPDITFSEKKRCHCRVSKHSLGLPTPIQLPDCTGF